MLKVINLKIANAFGGGGGEGGRGYLYLSHNIHVGTELCRLLVN